MLYSIVNPSNSYTMKAPDLQIAAVAAVLLGEGKYPLEPLDDEAKAAGEIPFFLFGGADAWFAEKFGDDMSGIVQRTLDVRAGELATALDSVLIGNERERDVYDCAIAKMSPADAEAFRKERHDRMRSSMNDIGARAATIAKALREKNAAATRAR